MTERPSPRYPNVPAQPRFPEIEKRVLAYWEREGIFRESVERRPPGAKGANEFVFYDGPPFANGLPHYGHLVTGFVKDIVPRYQTMRGPPRRAPLRLGLPRPARRDGRREGARRQGSRRSSSTGSRASTTTVASR